ncbi:MAG: Hsp33 family molecular chaperone HslO [Clostridia bacterium]|nr:Hsp33 family molecular chaperone HslO [Clostridia bacterium]
MSIKKDSCLKGATLDGSIRIWVADTTNTCEEARRRHDTWPVATAALGRLLTCGVFFGLNLKGDDTVTLRIEADGYLGNLLVTANSRGEVRGYLTNPHVDIERKASGKLDVGTAVGSGTLYVVKDMGLGEPYTGSVPLATGEIGDDIVRYLLDSEQTPSAVGVGVLVDPDCSVKAAGGFMVQLLPNATDFAIKQLELNIANLLPVTQMIEQKMTAEEIADEVLFGLNWQKLADDEVSFKCGCSKEKIEGVLISLGKDELTKIITEQGQAEVVCRFCNEKHCFSKAELEQLL